MASCAEREGTLDEPKRKEYMGRMGGLCKKIRMEFYIEQMENGDQVFGFDEYMEEVLKVTVEWGLGRQTEEILRGLLRDYDGADFSNQTYSNINKIISERNK